MQYKTLFLLLVLSLTLTSCGKKQEEQSVPTSPIPSIEATNSAEMKVKPENSSAAQVKENFELMTKTYKNPKVATLKDSKLAPKGKVSLQYNKKENQSSLWLKVNPKVLDASSEYTAWLMNTDIKGDKREVNLGKVSFLEDGTALLSHKFAEKGNYYSYNRIEIVKGSESVYEKAKFELVGNFSSKLSSL